MGDTPASISIDNGSNEEARSGNRIACSACVVIMNDGDYRDEVVRLEEQIDELTARIESCRKFILIGRIAVAAGAVVLIAMLVGAIQANPSVLMLAAAAVLGGIVAAGSNYSTAKEAARELTAAEARRTALIEQIDLRLVSDRNDRQ